MQIETGFYEHFKGGVYVVYGEAVMEDNTTGQKYVVYKPRTTGVDGWEKFYLRTPEDFAETIERPRFRRLTDEEVDKL